MLPKLSAEGALGSPGLLEVTWESLGNSCGSLPRVSYLGDHLEVPGRPKPDLIKSEPLTSMPR